MRNFIFSQKNHYMENNTLKEITLDGVKYVRFDQKQKVEPVANTPIGLYCIVRCRDAGVWAGTVAEHNGREVKIVDARRLWQWKAASGVTLSAVSIHGIVSSKVPESVDIVWVEDACEIIPCTKKSQESIESYEIATQS